MDMSKPTLCVDFDGTIVDHEFPEIGAPKDGVKRALTELRKYFRIMIYSCRTRPNDVVYGSQWEKHSKDMVDFLDNMGIPYDEIYHGEGKPFAYAYIDDRGIRFRNNWSEITDFLCAKVSI